MVPKDRPLESREFPIEYDNRSGRLYSNGHIIMFSPGTHILKELPIFDMTVGRYFGRIHLQKPDLTTLRILSEDGSSTATIAQFSPANVKDLENFKFLQAFVPWVSFPPTLQTPFEIEIGPGDRPLNCTTLLFGQPLPRRL